jgi:hypothetical protein
LNYKINIGLVYHIILMTEIWKTIENYETYSVSTFGNVRNDKTGRMIKGGINGQGRRTATLRNNGKSESVSFHRLAALAFIANPDNKNEVDHIDNNPLNNSIENLRWTTPSENAMNRQVTDINLSGVKGVHWCKSKQKWIARVRTNGKCFHLGGFDTIEEATIARQTKANEIFGVYTNASEKL